jgi:hypothetical protein
MSKGDAESWVLPGASGIWTAMGYRISHTCRHRQKIC